MCVLLSESDQRFSIKRTGKHGAGEDPGFLERGFINIYKGVWVCYAEFISFFLNIP